MKLNESQVDVALRSALKKLSAKSMSEQAVVERSGTERKKILTFVHLDTKKGHKVLEKLVFWVRENGELSKNVFSYLSDLNCGYNTVAFSSQDDLEEKLARSIGEFEKNGFLEALSLFFSMPSIYLNRQFSKIGAKNLSVVAVAPIVRAKSFPCEKTRLYYDISLGTGEKISLCVLKDQNSKQPYIYEFSVSGKKVSAMDSDSPSNIADIVASGLIDITNKTKMKYEKRYIKSFLEHVNGSGAVFATISNIERMVSELNALSDDKLGTILDKMDWIEQHIAVALENVDHVYGKLISAIKTPKLSEQSTENYMYRQNILNLMEKIGEISALPKEALAEWFRSNDWGENHLYTAEENIKHVHEFMVGAVRESLLEKLARKL